MHCHLFIPDFISAADDTLRLPSAEILFAKGRRERRAWMGREAWLFEQFSISRQHDWPVAPYSLLADGGTPERHFWMRADPVHLILGRDNLALSEDAGIEVSRDEAEALVETLNGHFGPSVRLYPMRPARWYARLDSAPEVQTTAPSAAHDGPVADHLPSGPDAMRFHVLMNEAQMLLHGHAVNAAREARGAPVLNSIWLWGGGVLAGETRSSITAVVSDDPLARGLALAAGLPARSLPRDAAALLESAATPGVVLVVLERRPWRSESLERDWPAPLLAALRSGRIGMLTLTLQGAESLLRSETVRSDLRHFWRLRRPLGSYAA